MLKPPSNIKIAALLLICSVTTACGFSQLAIRPEELKKSHDIIVIPYKPPPIYVGVNYGAGAAAAFGAIGLLANRAATKEERRKIADDLSKSAGSWDLSVATAEECLAILRANAATSLASFSIGELSELPGTEALRKIEIRKFTEDVDAAVNTDWGSVWSEFRNGNSSLIKYKKEHPGIRSDWALEVLSRVEYSSDAMYFRLYLKLTNTVTNERLSVGMGGGKYEIALQEGYTFGAFDQALRRSAQQACKQTLGEMGLIPR